MSRKEQVGAVFYESSINTYDGFTIDINEWVVTVVKKAPHPTDVFCKEKVKTAFAIRKTKWTWINRGTRRDPKWGWDTNIEQWDRKSWPVGERKTDAWSKHLKTTKAAAYRDAWTEARKMQRQINRLVERIGKARKKLKGKK